MIRRFDPSPARRSDLHRQIEARCGLSEAAAMLLVELDVFGEVQIHEDEHLPALAELQAKGLAELASTPHACTNVVPGIFVREILERVRSIMAIEGELARRGLVDRPGAAQSPEEHDDEPQAPSASLTPELERAIIDDALALIDQSPTLPAASEIRVYLKPGRRFVRVYWTYKRLPDGHGSLLHYVEIATGRIYRRGGSSKKIPTPRFVGSLHV